MGCSGNFASPRPCFLCFAGWGSLTTYVRGAFRAPLPDFFVFFWGYHPLRVTFVNSDKSNQKRRKPYGLDPLACLFRFRLRLHIHRQGRLFKGDVFHLNLGQPLAAL